MPFEKRSKKFLLSLLLCGFLIVCITKVLFASSSGAFEISLDREFKMMNPQNGTSSYFPNLQNTDLSQPDACVIEGEKRLMTFSFSSSQMPLSVVGATYVCVIIDTSNSMSDYKIGSYTRLETVKNIVTDIINNDKFGSSQVSIVGFNTTAYSTGGFIQLPTGKSELLQQLQNLRTHSNSSATTNMGDGLRLAYYNLLNCPQNSSKGFVIFSDGEADRYLSSPMNTTSYYLDNSVSDASVFLNTDGYNPNRSYSYTQSVLTSKLLSICDRGAFVQLGSGSSLLSLKSYMGNNAVFYSVSDTGNNQSTINGLSSAFTGSVGFLNAPLATNTVQPVFYQENPDATIAYQLISGFSGAPVWTLQNVTVQQNR